VNDWPSNELLHLNLREASAQMSLSGGAVGEFHPPVNFVSCVSRGRHVFDRVPEERSEE
jgi:hypothetical protein